MRLLFCLIILLYPAFGLSENNCNLSKRFKLSGYIDTSYNYLVQNNKFTSGVFDRVFDITPNGVTLQQAGLNFGYQPQEGFGWLFTPVIGRDPYIFAPYGWNPYYGSQWLGFAIPQGYLQYAMGSLTLMVGSFIELAGAENIFSFNDTNFSRGILWGYAEPFTELGFRAVYAPNDKLSVYAGLNNGWDVIRDSNRAKTIELGFSYTFNPLFSLASFLYSGQQRIADRTSGGPTGQRTLLDLILTFNLTSKFTFITNLDAAMQTQAALPDETVAQAVWIGVASYLNYKFSDFWLGSFRGEVFSDRNGYRTGVAQSWKEMTLTLSYTGVRNLILRLETRHDFSNVNAFLTSNGLGVNQNQQSFAIEGVYQFGV